MSDMLGNAGILYGQTCNTDFASIDLFLETVLDQTFRPAGTQHRTDQTGSVLQWGKSSHLPTLSKGNGEGIYERI